MTRTIRLLLLPLLVGVIAAPLRAATCSASTTPVGFGAYEPFAGQDKETTGTIHLDCDAVVSATVSLSEGSGSYVARTMSDGADRLTYNLYIDTGRTEVWGNGTQGSSTAPLTGTGTAIVYGRMPARQNAKPGTYSDTILVEIAY
jgi:spore coat protein U-like protein